MLLIVLELSFRVAGSIKDCYEGEGCRFNKIFYTRKIDEPISQGLTKKHTLLGYIPTPNWKGNINSEYWDNSYLSISKEGFRENGNNLATDLKVLAIGDSFTFGSQVSDNETWTSCLEKHLGTSVLNAGVFGYGAAQSLLRGKIELEKRRDISLVLFSILVGDNIFRDTLSYRTGYAKPFLYLDEDNNISWQFPESFEIPGTKGNPRWNILQFSYFYTYFSQRYNIFPDLSAQNLTRRGSYGVTEKQIIKFIINELQSLDIEYVVILQYPSYLEDINVLKERNELLLNLKESNINFLDLYDFLIDNDQRDKLWYGHHTKLGNQEICKEIYDYIVNSE